MEENNEVVYDDPVDLEIATRNAMNLTVEQAAGGLGITPEYLKKIEKKKAPITEDMSTKMSAFYGVEIKPIRRTPTPQHLKRPYNRKNQQQQTKRTEPDFDEPQYKVLNRELKRQNKILATEVIRLSNIIEKILTIGETVDEYTPGLMPDSEE